MNHFCLTCGSELNPLDLHCSNGCKLPKKSFTIEEINNAILYMDQPIIKMMGNPEVLKIILAGLYKLRGGVN